MDLLEQEDITIWDPAPAALAMVMPFAQVLEPRAATRSAWSC
ncbi:hypothetical protein [Lentzea flava]|nr:hypothetical protein [Lentzea flava]MCP2205356.1 hypothetical protein [Lentzea flava]